METKTSEETQVKGQIERIFYHNSGFLIARLDSGITVKGNIQAVQPGLDYEFTGRWETHPKFGEQLAFVGYRAVLPTSLDALEQYLQTICDGVGPTIARRITEAFGDATMEVLKTDPNRVAAEVNGISVRIAHQVAKALRDFEATERLNLELNEVLAGARISARVLNRIIEKWKEGAPAIIKADPYILSREIEGIGFLTADEIARRNGYDFNGPSRVTEGLVYTLDQLAMGRGHVCVPRDVLLSSAAELLSVTEDVVETVLREQTDRRITIDCDHVYLTSLHDAEINVARILRALMSATPCAGTPFLEGLAEDQKNAVLQAMNSSVFVLTGSPGSGKTTCVRNIIQSFPSSVIRLAAPTGKAAKRMQEQTGVAAQTIHRLLGIIPSEDGGFHFFYNESDKMRADVVVVDETSMVDIRLASALLSAIEPGTRLILVGDTNQLPAVGPGNVLRDIIASNLVPCVELTTIKRQDPGLIISNCHAIRNGNDIHCDNVGANDFFFIARDDEDTIKAEIVDLVARRLPATYTNLDQVRDIQVLSPMREKTGISCKPLNEVLQEKLNPGQPVPGIRFRAGDKVIQTKNNYELETMNGDVGRILEIDAKNQKMSVLFDNPQRTVTIHAKQNDLELAYAVTTHKAQGAEFKIVVIPIHKSFSPKLLQRSWIYTAISRARNLCILVGQRDEVTKAIQRNVQEKRHSKLLERLSFVDT